MLKCDDLAHMEELIRQITGVSASPGFTFGDSGNKTAGSYLLNDSVPSNRTGRIVGLKSGVISNIYVGVEDNTTCTIDVQKRISPGSEASNFSTLASITLTAERIKAQSYSGIIIAQNEELAVKVSSGSCKNPVVALILQGTLI